MTTSKFSLLMQLGPSRGETRFVSGEEFILGRDPSSGWPIDEGEVSRSHARLLLQNDNYAIEDLGSTNGTYVNGQRIRSLVPLEPGATIRLGENVLLFYDETLAEGRVAESQNPIVEEQSKVETPAQPAPHVELLEGIEKNRPSQPLAESQNPIPANPVPVDRVQNESPREIPFFRRRIVIGAAAVLILGLFALTAFLFYVDANFLWCDVFGSLIADCR